MTRRVFRNHVCGVGAARRLHAFIDLTSDGSDEEPQTVIDLTSDSDEEL